MFNKIDNFMATKLPADHSIFYKFLFAVFKKMSCCDTFTDKDI